MRKQFCYRIVFLFSLLAVLTACKQKQEKQSQRVTPQMLLEMNKKMVGAESEIIDKYIVDNHLEMQTSPTGLRYNIIKAPNGPLIKDGDAVSLKYTTSLLDSTVCYSSDKNGLMNFVVGKAQVEAGLEEAIVLFSKGAKATLILPPYLAHGIAGDGNKIPKLAIIIMDIEVMDVQSASDVETN